MIGWLVLGVLGLLESIASLFGGWRFYRVCSSAEAAQLQAQRVTLILPCRGVDPGLAENLLAFRRQQYPGYRMLFVTHAPDDAAVEVIRRVMASPETGREQLLFAGDAHGCSQKVHNLLFAVERASDCDVLVFGDSDIRPEPDWLASLVNRLESEPSVGIATGFRWYLPLDGRSPSIIRSVWNAGVVSLMHEGNNQFAWGGAMAIRRSDFESFGVRPVWERTLSDDFAISRLCHNAGRSICFAPRALSFSYEDCNWAELLEWTARQMSITRVYRPDLWVLSLIAQLINGLTLWGGLLILGVQLTTGGPAFSGMLIGALLLLVYGLGVGKATFRLAAIVRLFPRQAAGIRRFKWAYLLLGPVASLVSLIAIGRSAWSRTIRWRGIRYRMHSPTRIERLD